MTAKLLVNGHEVIIDECLRQFLSNFTWSIYRRDHTSYARTCIFVAGKTRIVSMHRLLMGLKAKSVDHINGNGLDNRIENLRLCSHSQNCWNSKKRKDSRNPFKGVYFKDNGWHARIKISGEDVHIGSFRDAETAARAYDSEARRLRGEFAKTNFND